MPQTRQTMTELDDAIESIEEVIDTVEASDGPSLGKFVALFLLTIAQALLEAETK